MRYINPDGLICKLSGGWLARAEHALAELRVTAPAERTLALQRQARLWQELKEKLAELSSRKCWYCETSDVRSDYVIDHYRPKGRVAEATGHPGYWWLAFDYRNFRLSCTYCNSRRRDRRSDAVGGKQDHFPLADESRRCLEEHDDVSREQPMLLDPTSQVDPTLLWFEPDGRAVPRYDEACSQIFRARAEISIQLFHLNEVMVTSRRREVQGRLSRTIRETHSQFSAAVKNCQTAQKALETAFRAIRDAISPKAPYSSAARAVLLAFRAEYPWLETILTTHE